MGASRNMRSMSETSTADSAPPPASGAEEYVALDFANSVVTLPAGHLVDFLDTPGDANRWLTAHGLAPADAGVQEACARQLRTLREHLRALFAARVADLPAPPEALSAVNSALSGAPTAALLYWDEESGPYRAAPCPTDEILGRALAALAANAADLLTGPDADRLTACGSPPCNRYLLRHGRRQWCSTRCGDRARAARAYARRTHPEAG